MGLIPVYLLEEKKWKDLGVHYFLHVQDRSQRAHLRRLCDPWKTAEHRSDHDLQKRTDPPLPFRLCDTPLQGKTRKHHGTWR